jgi:RimJ/RimL family protein N-acetyltransferase
MASIETPRLLLRPVEPGDLEELVRLHGDPLVARFIDPPTREWLAERIGWSAEEWAGRGHGLVAIVERSSGRFLGRTGLKYWPQFGETEAGWILHPEARGRGVATEAAAALVRWGFENLDLPYITAMIRPDNEASIAVAERLRMSPKRSDDLLGVRVIVYAVSRERWGSSEA